MIKNPVAITVAALGVVVVLWFVFQKNEDDRIRQRLHALARVVSTTQQQKDTARLMHIAGLKQFFTEDVTVLMNSGIPKVKSRDTLLQMAHLALQHEPSLTVVFKDISVTHDDGAQHARVNTTVVVSGAHSRKAKSVDAQELEMDMIKVGGKWRITAIRPVKAMELE